MSTPLTPERFFAVMSSILQVPLAQLNRESSRENVQSWDSLKHMHLIFALEEAFGVEFSDTEIAQGNQAGRLFDSLAKK